MSPAGRVVRARQLAQVPADPLDGGHGAATRNEVLLVGRVSGSPQERELPSGDRLVCWRLVVTRPAQARRTSAGGPGTTVDTLDCVAWPPGLRRAARDLVEGDVVEVTGALRRRFWRAGTGAASRTEIEVGTLRRLVRATG